MQEKSLSIQFGDSQYGRYTVQSSGNYNRVENYEKLREEFWIRNDDISISQLDSIIQNEDIPLFRLDPITQDNDTSISQLGYIIQHNISTVDLNPSEEIYKILLKKTLYNLYKVIDDIDIECREEGLAYPDKIAKDNAKKILNAIYEKFLEYEFCIYPTEEQEIAIDCNPQKGKGVLILCNSAGGVACFSTINGHNSHYRSSRIEDFSFETLWNVFRKFNQNSIYSLDGYKKNSSLLWYCYK